MNLFQFKIFVWVYGTEYRVQYMSFARLSVCQLVLSFHNNKSMKNKFLCEKCSSYISEVNVCCNVFSWVPAVSRSSLGFMYNDDTQNRLSLTRSLAHSLARTSLPISFQNYLDDIVHDRKCNDIFTFDLNNLISPSLNLVYTHTHTHITILFTIFRLFFCVPYTLMFRYHFHHSNSFHFYLVLLLPCAFDVSVFLNLFFLSSSCSSTLTHIHTLWFPFSGISLSFTISTYPPSPPEALLSIYSNLLCLFTNFQRSTYSVLCVCSMCVCLSLQFQSIFCCCCYCFIYVYNWTRENVSVFLFIKKFHLKLLSSWMVWSWWCCRRYCYLPF